MRENRPFSQKEDDLIINLYQIQNIKKWSMIARTLTEEHNLPRNAKQCRDRYNQFLDPLMSSEWTPEEEERLYQLHDEIGNKWAVIAQKFVGRYFWIHIRTDNCVKNHFYSKLRKSLRLLNKVIKTKFRKEFKELRIGSIYKIIEALEERFNENTSLDQQVFNKCIMLKRSLLEYSGEQNPNEQSDFEREEWLIKQILQFSKTYRRKTKKERRSSFNGFDLFKPSSLEKRMKYSDQSESDSSYSVQLSQNDDNDSNQSRIELRVIEEDIRESCNSNIRVSLGSLKEYMYEAQQKNNGNYDEQRKTDNSIGPRREEIEDQLKEIIEQGQIVNNRPQISNSHNTVSLKSESEKGDMFDDNLRISNPLCQIEEMVEEDPENSIFRSQK